MDTSAIAPALTQWMSQYLDHPYPIQYIEFEPDFRNACIGALDILSILPPFEQFEVLSALDPEESLSPSSRYRVEWYARIESPQFDRYRDLLQLGIRGIGLTPSTLFVYIKVTAQVQLPSTP